ncbi:uncharacterized protein CcaverHIS019_0102070 [Cutaneotrichosporon cavernicola]|uniref:HbrB-domain-containing protein n=1 Tax=Cutaneotrichosporon cavernicola TaxID=279322 RepID=A0AA48HXT0_9TREE|nr:uncharacterized protein CcaverHIS019_0102070 [Cutaneotrichosporon cavernicola]BEI87489.1 hypothetical protein CcaverHIS019_0102070 [Cutaneotrichosporon cavernicola]BEI95260.1 hypothetical protein CcaverHIS631_0102090 [Cutaneotrichosporon cavernicola]BEJ03033.1 hypothetical protein CcaverHIS641_0102080 [Cutaneotrichosporon cavernicola]
MTTTPSRKQASSQLSSPMVWNTNVMATSPSPSPSSARPRLNLDVRDKRLPSLPSPLSRGKDGSWALGAYDNKLVSSTLSQLPPLPPHSPGGMSSTGSNLSSFSHSSSPSHVPRGTPSLVSVSMPRPAPQPSSAGGVLLLPDGTTLPTGEPGGQPEREPIASGPHSSSSPWSLLTVHVLPLFAGSPLKTAIEDLNHLCNSHIVTTSQRTPASRLIGVLTADLRDFIASGMLTLKAKFDTIDEAKVVSRAAEVWSFFWSQILPYIEAVFLPLSQVRDIPTSATARPLAIVQQPPIAVRHILLSGFLVHILLPLLPRLIPLLTAVEPGPDLPRLLQMCLVLSTQARYSSFYTPREPGEAEAHDLETSESVDELARAVRWSMVVRTVSPEPVQSEAHERKGSVDTPRRPGLTRAPSLSQAGRIRRRNRGSGSISSLEPELKAAMGERRGTWEGPTIHEGEEQSLAPTTLRDETLQGSVATLTDRTPTADRARLPAAAAAAAAKSAAAAGARRHARKYSSGESDLSSVFSGMGRR